MLLLSSEEAGGTSTSCSDLQHRLGWSFAGVTSWLCHLQGGPCWCWCPVHPPQPGENTGRFGMGSWLVAGEAVHGWELGWEPLGWLWEQPLPLRIQAPFAPCNRR